MIVKKLIFVVLLLVVVLGMTTKAEASDEFFSEEELSNIISRASTIGDLSYIPLERYYYDPVVGHKKILQILSKFEEVKGVKIAYFCLDKDFDSNFLHGIYIVHSPK